MSEGYIFECEDCGAVSRPYGAPWHVTQVRGLHVCERSCPHCGYRTAASKGQRGLCKVCYMDPDVRIDYELSFMRADDMLDTWDELRREGYTVRQAAERMGVTFAALDKALCRGKRRGDPRARRPGESVGAA